MLKKLFHYNCINITNSINLYTSFYITFSFVLHKSLLQNFENHYNSKNFNFS